MRISENTADDILSGYPGLKTETLGEARGGTTEEDEVIVTPLFPARVRAPPPQAA